MNRLLKMSDNKIYEEDDDRELRDERESRVGFTVPKSAQLHWRKRLRVKQDNKTSN